MNTAILQATSTRRPGFWIRRLGVCWLSLLFIFSVLGEWMIPTICGFDPEELHPESILMPPGGESIPANHPVFDGNISGFQYLDTDRSGFIECNPKESAGEKVLRCPELLETKKLLRQFQILIQAGVEGPSRQDFLGHPIQENPLMKAWGWKGEDGFRRLDTNRDGNLSNAEWKQETRLLHWSGKWVGQWDRNRDGRMSPGEFPGAPLAESHILGTDGLGRDLFARLIQATGNSFLLALGATALALCIGFLVGAFGALTGGKTDRFLDTLVHLLYGLPSLFVFLVLLSWFRPGAWTLCLILGGFQWITVSRVIRARVKSLSEEPFVQAARAMGGGTFWILRHHILRNTRPELGALFLLLFPVMIQEEAFLSFLGMGIQAPEASWGTLLLDGIHSFQDAWWLISYPAITLTCTLLAVHKLAQTTSRGTTT